MRIKPACLRSGFQFRSPWPTDRVARSNALGWLKSTFAILILCTGAITATGQYSIGWSKISGGGGSSGNAQYSVTGTMGQYDAGAAMSGGSYSLTGGFWSLVSVVQTPGLPMLTMTRSGTSINVSWPDTGSFTLQQNGNLSDPAGWGSSGYTVNTTQGTNSITIASPSGIQFFRLKQ